MPPIVYVNTFTRLFCSFLLIILLLPFTSQGQTIRYVSTTGTNTNPTSATTWASSTTSLQGAINASASGDQVWVAQGVYKPTLSTGPGSRTISFSMKAGVTIYGGFAASGSPSLVDRNPASYTTVLSGDIDNDGQLSGNSYHVIYNNFNSLDNTALLQGFIITGGNADGVTFVNSHGGGVFNLFSSPRLRACTITNNHADVGGGIANSQTPFSGNSTFTNCIISNNTASSAGGGISADTRSTLRLTGCIIRNNSSGYIGGGIINDDSYFYLTNCLIHTNTASNAGGGIHSSYKGSIYLTNSTLTGNSATSSSAISMYFSSTFLINSIVWNNGAQKAFGNVSPGWEGRIYATYSHIESGAVFTDNGHNLTATTSPFASDNNFQLSAGSPAIDQGSNQAYASGPAYDLAGNARIFNSIIDMGAYEYGAPPVPITPMPVTLVHFSANRFSPTSIGIEWQTSLETNSDYFEVQRSLDAHEFSPLAQLKAQGNTTQQQNYQYIDNLPLTQITYYRLRMVDRDGSVAYSKIVAISPLADQALLRLVENPVSNGSLVRVWLWGYQLNQLHLYRLTGQAVEMHIVAQGDGSVGLVTGERLAPGHYIVSAWDGTHRQSLRVVIK